MEATMETLGLTVEDLKGLPLRAIVAWAARCARRVQPLNLSGVWSAVIFLNDATNEDKRLICR